MSEFLDSNYEYRRVFVTRVKRKNTQKAYRVIFLI